MMQKVYKFMMKINLYYISILLVFLVSSCTNRKPEDYLNSAKKQLSYLMYDQGLNDSDINKMRLLSIDEDSLKYRFKWYQIAETGDSITVYIKIKKKWPYSSNMNSFSNSMDILKKDRMSLRNLFDTTIVNNKNIDKYILIGQSDSIDWIVNKDKIVDHIKRGHYLILRNRQRPYYLELFIDIGKTKVEKYHTWEVKVDFLEKNKILITPITLPDSAYCYPDTARLGTIYKYRVK